jgi:hypothetical protein
MHKVCNARGFRVVEIHADKEFEKVETDLLPVRLRICRVDEHVPEIEGSAQTQKNENRAACFAVPFKCITRLMVRELVKQGNEFLNAFGTKDSISDGLSPRNIIDNHPHVDHNDLKYKFGQFVQLYVAEKVTNTMKSRTIGAIVLGPRRIQGQCNCMSLETGEKIDGRVVAVLPITDDVIKRVEALGHQAQAQRQPFRGASRMFQYEWRPGQALGADDACLDVERAVEHNLLVPVPINQEQQAQDPNPFAVLATDDDDDDDEDVEVPFGQLENQGAEEFNNEQNDFELIQEDQGAQQVEPVQEPIEVEDVDDEEESDDDSEDKPDRREEERARRSVRFDAPDENNYGRGKRKKKNLVFVFTNSF